MSSASSSWRTSSRRGALDAHRVNAAAERAEVQRQLSQVRTKRARLLDLYLSEMLSKPAFETKDTPLRQDEDRLAVQLAQADAAVAQTTASASRHAAAGACCKLR